MISRTGYTGSFGYELYCQADDIHHLWQALLEAGKELGLTPCGLGARDTLRLEASMPLYGHEMNEEITPYETGLGFTVKMEKENFIGKQALLEKRKPQLTRVGIELIGRGIAREEADIVLKNGQKIGKTTSGTYSPYIAKAIAMALVDKEFSAIDTEIDIVVRNKKIPAKIVQTPFYKW
ncbi:aminomethyltransferase family protein [Enterococcus rivorum]|uniref:aminomethyltransferase family protein n=1 Tax=Enterococcus rivorum TaxID=762845 RepID=UPI003635E77F